MRLALNSESRSATYMGRLFMRPYSHTKTPQLVRNMPRCGRSAFSGQAMVEFALVLFVAMIVLFVAIQMAFIGQTALALGQINYQGARFAAVNQCATPSDVATYMVINGSPTITKTCGSQSPALTITV